VRVGTFAWINGQDRRAERREVWPFALPGGCVRYNVNFERWTTLSRLLDEVLELGPGDRTRWVERLGPEHQALQPRLRQLLSGDRGTGRSRFQATIPPLTAPLDTGELESEGGDPGAQAESEPALEAIGPYRVLRKVGEGGMGAVWLAHRTDGMVKRLVALKLPRISWAGAGFAARMAQERDILASLDHHHIARLYDAGVTSTGQPYLAIEYVDGRPLDEYVTAHGLGVRSRLQLFLQVARAVAHAHARLIIHRDLKPSNILVTDGGEVKLLDFGIAKLLEDERTGDTPLTEVSGRPLTPDYASPEQITGDPLSIASDIYSLGVLLFELLAGVRPYALPSARGGRQAIEQAMRAVDPRRASEATADPSIRRQLQGDLDTILLKALKKEPDQRYATVNAFAEDVERYLQGRTVLARPDSAWYRWSKWVARNRIACATAAVVVVSTLSGAGVAAWQAQRAFTEKNRAEEVRDLVITIFRDASPYTGGAGRALSAVDWLKQVKARVDHRLDDRPELRVELLNIVGSSLLTLQDTAGAERVLSQAVQDATTHLGAEHPQTLHARVLMTPVYRFRGQTRELRAELDRLLPVLRAHRAALAEDLVVALKNQAHLEIDDGRYAAAEAAAREAADIGVSTLGPQHPETVGSLLMLAYAYQFTRPPDEALHATERAYRLALEVHADTPMHPRVIEGRLLFGRALGQAGELSRGVEELAHAVRDAATVFGPASRMVGFFSEPLARFQTEAGEIDGAIESSRRAAAIVAGHSQPDSFRNAVALHARGAALLAARRLDDALPDLARAAAILQGRFPATNEFMRTFQTDYALAVALAGRPLEAERLVASVMPDGAGSDDAASGSRALYVLGVISRIKGDPRTALRFQQRSLTVLPGGRNTDIDRMRALTEVGLNLHALGQPAQAIAFLREALVLSMRAQTRPSPARADILAGLGRATLALQRTAVRHTSGSLSRLRH
jgi:serine/threonine protein kinase